MAEVIERLPFESYCELPGVHATALKNILVSPRKYKRALAVARPDTDQLRVGRGGHTSILEPDRFLLEYTVWRNAKNGKTRQRKGKVWDAFKLANADKTVLTEHQYTTAINVRDSLRSHPQAAPILSERGRSEVTILWTHERTGLQCTSRIDWLCSSLNDIKLTHDPDERRFGAIAANFDYALQLAFYLEACRVAGLGDLPVNIIAAQSVEPYDAVVFPLDDEILDFGRERFELGMTRLVECTKNDSWPGMADDAPVPLRLPAWASPSLADEPLTMDGAPLF